jgi:hypothetical protein
VPSAEIRTWVGVSTAVSSGGLVAGDGSGAPIGAPRAVIRCSVPVASTATIVPSSACDGHV